MKLRRLAVFISGRGSNLVHALDVDADVRLVVTSKGRAAGVAKALRRGVPVIAFDGNWIGLIDALTAHRVENVFLLGFMKLLPKAFLEAFERQIGGRVVNLHPSLLPSYPGLRAIERAFDDQAELGVTIHEVIEQMDAGAPLFQRSVGRELQRYCDLHAATFWVSNSEAHSVRKVAGQT